AKQLVHGRDRKQLERLCRYITRPPFSQDRLELRPDGRVELTLKSVWRDGTRAVVYEPLDFLARLIATIPPPKFHLLRYFGVLSSHSALRPEVVPLPPDDPTLRRPPPAPGDQLELELSARDETPPPRNSRLRRSHRYARQPDLA
ncbi:MAG: transposase, partial [Polyangiaceae bacterium]